MEENKVEQVEVIEEVIETQVPQSFISEEQFGQAIKDLESKFQKQIEAVKFANTVVKEPAPVEKKQEKVSII
ncbi:MAG: hypothetical protein ACRCXY_11380 [Fusobacteriaceae bacterium]